MRESYDTKSLAPTRARSPFGPPNAALRGGRTAEGLLKEHAGFKDGDVRLLLARALEARGDTHAAEGVYGDAIKSFSGEEARYRYAAMLKALGQGDRAQALLRELLGNAERSPRFYQDAQSDWIRAAKRELGG